MKNVFENKSIENLINDTMQNLHVLVEANNIVGESITTQDGTVIIPISKVSVGYVVGGGEYVDVACKKKIDNYPLAGGSGGGVSITPVGFLVSTNQMVQYIDIDNKTAVEKVFKILNTLAKRFGAEGKHEK